MSLKDTGQHANCMAMSDVLNRIGDKWSVMIVGYLTRKTMRFNELRHAIGNLQADAVGGRNLEQACFKSESLGDVPGGRKRLLDGDQQAFGAAIHVTGRFTPLDQSVFTQWGVAGDEVLERGADLIGADGDVCHGVPLV